MGVFLIRSNYDVLPSAANLIRWGVSKDDKCKCSQAKISMFPVFLPYGILVEPQWVGDTVTSSTSGSLRSFNITEHNFFHLTTPNSLINDQERYTRMVMHSNKMLN